MTEARTTSATKADPSQADYRFWCEEKLRNADTDMNGHVNNAVISTLFEAGRIDTLAGEPIAHIRRVTSIVVAKLLINFHKELFFPGKVRVGSRVSRIGRSSIEFDSAIFAANGVVATAQATCVLIDRGTRKPMAVPDELRAYLTGG